MGPVFGSWLGCGSGAWLVGDGVGVVGVVDRRAGFGGWIGWVDRWVDRFETVDLLISGWIIGNSGDDFF